MVADCPWWRVVTGAGCLWWQVVTWGGLSPGRIVSGRIVSVAAKYWWQVVTRGGLSPGRFVHGGRLSMVAGCLGASCHPGRVVSGGRLSRADCLGGSKVLVAGCHPGRVVTGAGCLGADCLGAGCHWGGLSRGAMSLHPFSSFKVSRITVALAGQLKYKSWKRRLYCGLFAASYNLFVSDF